VLLCRVHGVFNSPCLCLPNSQHGAVGDSAPHVITASGLHTVLLQSAWVESNGSFLFDIAPRTVITQQSCYPLLPSREGESVRSNEDALSVPLAVV